ncbi:E3 ubiquitin-protein ligase MARCHF11-like [Hemitrygon akajei]|uniref:E3 ubiquitin-protein ligase MARCHF11-like n=1 Tax=Hemitrygon akajei TaxID=2704970 RepID=UPI003BF9A41B
MSHRSPLQLQQREERNGNKPLPAAPSTVRSSNTSPDGGALDGGSRTVVLGEDDEEGGTSGGLDREEGRTCDLPSPAANDAESVCSSNGSCRNGGITPTCRICFQGSEQGELLSPCRCDGSVRYSHQPCLLKWISERGSWSCEICCYRYHVVAIRMKRPCQWEPITVTLVEKVQIIAVILGCLFLIASVTWLLWSAFSPSAVWQRKDVLFQICYGMYGFMDLVCIGLIIHEGAAIYRVFKRWRAVNLHWTVLNYDKANDLEVNSHHAESSVNQSLWSSLNQFRTRRPVGSTRIMAEPFHCSYTLLHLLNRLRAQDEEYDENSSAEVVMRVTTV